MSEQYDFTIARLGECRVPSPLKLSRKPGDLIVDYVDDEDLILYEIAAKPGETRTLRRQDLLEKAGPREQLFFDPAKVHAAVVTCGGLCPGLNDVIRAIVMSLWHQYGVRRISGIRFGYRGLVPDFHIPALELTPDLVEDINRHGGTILGSSRGSGERTVEIVDTLERMNVNMLFTIGGDGTQKGALRLAEEIERRKLKVAVVGIPKTIDNDLSFIEKSFGFETAVAKAAEAVVGAHVEAHDAVNGVAIVKLMGRESGFIAAHTALGTADVNYCLVPEVPFELDGDNGILAHLKRRLERRNHAVIVVAEGAGQELLEKSADKDASGNRKLGDIGLFLRDTIAAYFKKDGIEISLKYIDPSYLVRCTPAIPSDAIYCTRLATSAVHAAMAGRTKMLASLVNNTFVHVPMQLAVGRRNRIDPEGSMWRDVLQTTGQPLLFRN